MELATRERLTCGVRLVELPAVSGNSGRENRAPCGPPGVGEIDRGDLLPNTVAP
jgi:hypothetical protein